MVVLLLPQHFLVGEGQIGDLFDLTVQAKAAQVGSIELRGGPDIHGLLSPALPLHAVDLRQRHEFGTRYCSAFTRQTVTLPVSDWSSPYDHTQAVLHMCVREVSLCAEGEWGLPKPRVGCIRSHQHRSR